MNEANLAQENPNTEGKSTELSDEKIIAIISEYKLEAETAFSTRRALSKINWDAFRSLQDWSFKIDGQNTEFLPKTALAVRQFANFIRRGLMGSSDWFEVSGKSTWLTVGDITALMLKLLEKVDFPSVVMESVKIGSLSSLCILKVYMAKDKAGFKIAVDAVDALYFYPDPTGRKLYEIQLMEKDLYQIAQQYEKEAVSKLTTQEIPAKQEAEDRKNQDLSSANSRRKPVVISEFWGTLLDETGKVLIADCRAVLGNEKVVLKKPEKNTFWDSESPFIVTPLDKIPGSVWHKAIFDDAVSLNLALNEIFNLMLDGGMGAVHGVRTIRTGDILNVDQVSGGISTGTTLQIKDEVPRNAKVFTFEKLGEVPPDAINIYTILDREFEEASMVSSIKMGSVPQKRVLATEIIESEKNSSVLFDGIVTQIEGFASNGLRKIWLLALQYISQLDMQLLVEVLGEDKATRLAISTKEERQGMASAISFRVKGVSAMTAKARTYQKLMALLQVAVSNPLVSPIFQQEYSVSKILSLLIKSLDVNPADLKVDEMEVLQNKLLSMAQPGSAGSSADNKGFSQEQLGDFSLASEINQNIQPTGGLGNG